MEYLGARQFGPHKKVLEFDSNESLPELEENDLLIEVKYVELNPVDLQKLNAKPGLEVPTVAAPLIVGYGGSGIVSRVGTGLSTDEWAGKRVCFLCDSSRPGSYATHVAVDHRCVSVVPFGVSLEHAATVPLAGCTAYESMIKLDMQDAGKKTLLVVGAAGGVGSWAMLLARARYPSITIIATAGSQASRQWCEKLGATNVITHEDIANLGGGPKGSVDYILCLTEPTPEVFAALREVIKPYGSICLVVSGKSIQSLDCGFLFFKAVTLTFETVFTSSRTKYDPIVPAKEMSDILMHLQDETIPAVPLSPQLSTISSLNWKDCLQDEGVLDQLASGHTQGKLIMKVEACQE
jgi:NADPH:quinone reductase